VRIKNFEKIRNEMLIEYVEDLVLVIQRWGEVGMGPDRKAGA
jgi:hypothetical protein